MSTADTPSKPPVRADDDRQVTLRNKIGLWLGPLLFVLILLFVDLDNALGTRMAAVVVPMAVWWVTEAIPIPATALLPLLLIPTAAFVVLGGFPEWAPPAF